MSRIRRIIVWPFIQLHRLVSWFVKTLQHFFSRLINGFKRHWLSTSIVVILCAVFFILWGGYKQGWEWTGFPAYSGVPANPANNTLEIASYREKTLWDWMSLILVPLTLFGIATLFNQQVRTRDQRREAHEEDLAKQARQERYREDALQSYFTQMATLMLDHGLLTDALPVSAPVWKLAQLRTVTVLRRMSDENDDNGTDIARVEEILTFLRDSGLLVGDRGVLAGATLTGVMLPKAPLWEANLQGVNLDEASLRGTYLADANLKNASFYQSKLEGIIAHSANMHGTYLHNAQLQKADLMVADLQEANLTGANLESAYLLNTNLLGANLTGTIFNDQTVLPDARTLGSNLDGDPNRSPYYQPGVTDMARYTDPNHSDFWQPEWVKKQQATDNAGNK